VSQPTFAQLTGFCVHTCNLLETRMIVITLTTDRLARSGNSQLMKSLITEVTAQPLQRDAKEKPPRQRTAWLYQNLSNYSTAFATVLGVQAARSFSDFIALPSSLSISNTADNFVIWSRSLTRLFRFTSRSCPP